MDCRVPVPALRKAVVERSTVGEMHGGGPLRLRTFERVCREVKMSLYAVSSLLPARPEADEHVQALLDSLGSCQEM